MMKEYCVDVNARVYDSFYVEAKNEEEANQIAIAKFVQALMNNFNIIGHINTSSIKEA